MASTDSELLEVLERAQRQGFIGPGSLRPHITHAGLFVAALEQDAQPGLVVDLGSGGGLPALPAALRCPDRTFLLVESQQRRADHLRWAVEVLGLTDRVAVAHGRAEAVVADHRAEAAAVLARAFGPPATTAECAAPFLQRGGVLIVSEPPGASDPTRWDAAALAEWGQTVGPRRASPAGAVQLIIQHHEAPATLPRRVGAAAKHPKF